MRLLRLVGPTNDGMSLIFEAVDDESVGEPWSESMAGPAADIAAGIYDGDVISDARGAGRSNVRLTVVKTGPNTISVTANYPRLPPFTTKLMRAMNTIQRAGGPGVFLLDLSKSPQHLDITVDDASWSGMRSY